jgi:hypothetical protein
VTPEIFASLWTKAKRRETPDDAELARLQKYMVMHDDMHEAWDRFEQDPSQPPLRDGENLMLHVIMDAATEKALEWDQPPGIRKMLQGLLDGAVEPTAAFHVLSQAMQHEFLAAAAKGNEMDQIDFMVRAKKYADQAFAERRGE